MEVNPSSVFVIIPAEELEYLKKSQQQIIRQLDHFNERLPKTIPRQSEYVLAEDFMNAVNIKRWKFNELIAGNLIKTIKKKRKIYVLATEIDRFFKDPSIQ